MKPSWYHGIWVAVLCLISACGTADVSQGTASMLPMPSNGVIIGNYSKGQPMPNLLPDTVQPISETELPQIIAFIEELDSVYQWDQDVTYNCCEQRAFVIRNALAAHGWNSWILMNRPKGTQIEVTIPTQTHWYDQQIEWAHHTVPIARIQRTNGIIEELVFDVHFGTLPQSVDDWLSFQNLTQTTLYGHNGQYYCPIEELLSGTCQTSSSNADATYFECLDRSQEKSTVKIDLMGAWEVGRWNRKGANYNRVTVDSTGKMCLYQDDVLILQGPLLYHPKATELFWKTTLVAPTIPTEWGLSPNNTTVVEVEHYVFNQIPSVDLTFYFNHGRQSLQLRFDQIKN